MYSLFLGKKKTQAMKISFLLLFELFILNIEQNKEDCSLLFLYFKVKFISNKTSCLFQINY